MRTEVPKGDFEKIIQKQTPEQREQVVKLHQAKSTIRQLVLSVPNIKEEGQKAAMVSRIKQFLEKSPADVRPELLKVIDSLVIPVELKNDLIGVEGKSTDKVPELINAARNQARSELPGRIAVASAAPAPATTSPVAQPIETATSPEKKVDPAPVPEAVPTKTTTTETGAAPWLDATIKGTGDFFNNIGKAITGFGNQTPNNLAGSPEISQTEAAPTAPVTAPAETAATVEQNKPLDIKGMMESIKKNLAESIPTALGVQEVLDSLKQHQDIYNLVIENQGGAWQRSIQYIGNETAKGAEALMKKNPPATPKEVETYIENSVMSFLGSLNFGQVALDPVKGGEKYVGKAFHDALRNYWSKNKAAVIAQSKIDAPTV